MSVVNGVITGPLKGGLVTGVKFSPGTKWGVISEKNWLVRAHFLGGATCCFISSETFGKWLPLWLAHSFRSLFGKFIIHQSQTAPTDPERNIPQVQPKTSNIKGFQSFINRSSGVRLEFSGYVGIFWMCCGKTLDDWENLSHQHIFRFDGFLLVRSAAWVFSQTQQVTVTENFNLTWRIIPVSKWLVTTVNKSAK